jgi:hypothetical protein
VGVSLFNKSNIRNLSYIPQKMIYLYFFFLKITIQLMSCDILLLNFDQIVI